MVLAVKACMSVCLRRIVIPIWSVFLLFLVAPTFLNATANPSGADPDKGFMTGVISVVSEETESGTMIRVVGNGKIPDYITTTLDSPLRIVFDFCNPADLFKPQTIPVESAHLEGIRLGYHNKRIRLVLDIKGGEVPRYTASHANEGLTIFLESGEGLIVERSPDKEQAVTGEEADEERVKHTRRPTPGRAIRPSAQLLKIEADDGQADTALFRNAVEAYREHDWPGVIDNLNQLMQAYPDGRYEEKGSFLLAKSYQQLHASALPTHFIDIKSRYQDAINRYPDSVYVPEAYLAMGDLCFNTKNYYEALAYFNIIGKNYFDSPAALPALMRKARVLGLKKKTREALSILESVVEGYPGTREETEANIEIAKILYETHNFRRSLEILSKLSVTSPEERYRYPEIALYLGHNYYQMGDNVRTRENLYRFYNSAPDDERNHLVLTKIGDTYRDEGLVQEAVKLYQLVLKCYPEKEGALISLIRLAEQQEAGGLHIPRGIAPRGTPLQREIEAPVEIYEKVLKTILAKDERNPLAQLALLKLAILYHKHGDYAKSFETLKRLLTEYPLTKLQEESRGALAQTLGDMLAKEVKAGRYINAINIYQREKDLFMLINLPDPFLSLARAFLKLNLKDFAAEMFAKADPYLPIDEKPADLLFYVGTDLAQRGKLNESLSRLDLLIENFADDQNAPHAYRIKGGILFQQKRYEPAVQMYSSALHYHLKDCERARILAEKARALIECKKRSEALKVTREADGLKKACYVDYQPIYKVIGDLYLDLGYAKEGLKAFKDALEAEKRDENRIVLKLRMAECYGLLHRKDSCLSLYDEVAALNDPFWSVFARERIQDINFESEVKTTKKTPLPPLSPPPQKDRAAIKQLIATWQQAWERKDLDRYLACYTDDCTAGGLTKKAWERHKTRLNKRYTTITVGVSNLAVEVLSTREALASFDQDYRSDHYHDWGRKTLHLVKRGQRWKIRGETWLQAAQPRGN
jgi:TolA-binding protein/ketosteroid isomerase-like protein